jgi:SAM-dependent methyltransferase
VTTPTDRTLAAYQDGVDQYLAGSPTDVSEQVAALLEEVVASVPGGEVLELGTGPGREAQYLEHRGLRVQRTDATPAFVGRLRRAGHQARLLDVRSGELGGPFDAVLANAVLLHLDRSDLEHALRACHAATRPNGVFALTLKEGDGEAWSDAKLAQPRWFVYWREPALRQALNDAGWTVVSLGHVQGRVEPWLHVLCRRGDS